MVMLVQRTPSMLSVEYLLDPKQDYPTMDDDADICRLFGSLNLTACGPFQAQSTRGSSQSACHDVREPIQSEDTSMSMQSETMEATDRKTDLQPSTESFPCGSTSEGPAEVEGCALIQMLVLHYAPRLSHLTSASPGYPDFNLLETILSHREAFVAFPYVHQTCSSALTKVAFEIERRYNEGGSFSEGGDIDTAIALHNEAWLMSGWYNK